MRTIRCRAADGSHILQVNETGVVISVLWKDGIVSSTLNGSVEKVRRRKLTKKANGDGSGCDDPKSASCGETETASFRIYGEVKESSELRENYEELRD